MKLMSLGNCCVFDRSKQLDAASIQELVEPTGDIRLLPSSKDFDWKTTRERAGSLVCHGPIITMGKARYANIKYCEGEYVSSNNMLIKPRDKSVLDCRYLFHFLKQYSPKAYVEGTTYPKFDLNRFNEITMPLPPLDHQKKIASFFDLIEEQINGAKAQISLLDEQVKSLFNELFTNHKELLSYLPLEKVVEEKRPITYGVVKPGPFTPGGVPIIKVKDFPNGVVDAQEFYLISSELASSYKRSTLKTNDLLISIRGAIGKTAFVPPELDGANLTQDTARVSIKSEYNRHYIRAAIDSDLIQEDFKQHTVGVAVKGINLGYLRTVLIPVPPKTIQDDYAMKVSEIDKLRFNYQHQIDLLNELLEAKMEEYFGGAFDAN